MGFLILILAGSIPALVLSQTKPPIESVTQAPDLIDQQPEGSIAHHQYVNVPGIVPLNNIAQVRRGLTPPPPPAKEIQILETSQAQSYPRRVSPQAKSRRRIKGRRQKPRTFENLDFGPEPGPPPIPQEPDIPDPEEEDEVEEVTQKPVHRDFIPNSIPKEMAPDDVDTSESEEGRVYKHISVHVPPEDLDEDVSSPRVIKVAKEPEKHLRVIFIKPDPDTKVVPKTEVQLPPGPLQRTLVYVLTSAGVPAPIKLVKPTTPKPIPPQVYFLRYTNPNPTSAVPVPPPSPTAAVVVREKEKAIPRPGPTRPPPIKQQVLPQSQNPAKSPPLLPVNIIQPTVTVPLALHSPILYTYKNNYKILNTPANYRLSHLANNHHHHQHYTPLITTPLEYPLTSTYNPSPYRYTSPQQNYYRHHHHHHPTQYLYSPSPIVTYSNPFTHQHQHHYYDHNHSHRHDSHTHRKHTHYHPVVNTRFIYSCTLFEER